MPTEKLAITLSPRTLKFIDAYRKEHSLKSRSDVIEAALALLRETEREEEISEAPEEDELTESDLSEINERDETLR
jgi:Arc/MetJ-type ribon-helix-helix transcriptional regulator